MIKICPRPKLIQQNTKIFNIFTHITYFVVLIIYFSFIATLFYPFSKCTHEPALKYDYAFLYSNAINSTFYAQTSLQSSGFNPFFAAGITEPEAISGRIIILFNLLFPYIPSPLLYNLAILLLLLSLPIIIKKTAAKFELPSHGQKYVVIYCALFLIGSKIGREFIYIGHFGFLFSSFLSFYAASNLYHYIKYKRNLALLLSAFSLSLAIWSHIFSIVVFIPLGLGILFFKWKTLTFKQHSTIVLFFGGGILIPNLFWLAPFTIYLLTCYQPSIVSQFLQTGFIQNIDNFFDLVNIVIFVIFGIGLLSYKNHTSNFLLKLFSFPIIYFLIISILGTQIGLSDLQPTRFIIPFIISLLLFASYFQHSFHLILVPILLATASFRTLTSSHYKHESICGFNDERAYKLLQFIKQNLSPNTRLHIQDSVYVPYFKSRIASVLPLLTGIPILSDPFPFPHVPSFSQFCDNKLFNKDLSQISFSYLEKNIQLYNIGYFLTFSKNANMLFTKYPTTQKIYADPPFSIYKVTNLVPNYCYKCNATIVANLNKIEVTNATDSTTILKYHYHSTMKIVPQNIKIEPIYIGDDYYPFIKVLNGDQRNFTLYEQRHMFDDGNIELYHAPH